jgi:Ankyrin repeats (3 copies)
MDPKQTRRPVAPQPMGSWLLNLVSFQQLVERRQFDKIRIILQKEHEDDLHYWLFGRTIPNDNDSTEMYSEYRSDDGLDDDEDGPPLDHESPLHLLVATVRPPVDVVQILIQSMADIFKNVPEDMTDVNGQTPLHVVAKLAGRSELVRLLAKNSTAALMQDVFDRCPLHWACTHPYQEMPKAGAAAAVAPKRNKPKWLALLLCQSKGEKEDAHLSSKLTHTIDNDEMVLTVDTLLRAYPEATLLRDQNGQTPLDLATENGADERILSLLEWTTTRLRKKRKKQSKDRALLRNSHNSDETSSTDHESSRHGFPSEISLVHSTEHEDDFEQYRLHRSDDASTTASNRPSIVSVSHDIGSSLHSRVEM